MLRMLPIAGGIALCLALPALAQGPMYGPSNHTTGSMSSDDTSAMSCDQIMKKVKSMSTYAHGATMAHTRKEMIAARAAKADNDGTGCKMHATKALQIIMNRT